MICVFPEWQESEESEVPISVIRFDVPKFRKLTHRDYLVRLCRSVSTEVKPAIF